MIMAILAARLCEGSSNCVGKMVTSVGASVLLLIVAALFASRYLRVNVKRRMQGKHPLRWSDIADANTVGDAVAADDETIVAARELTRQMAWERQQASNEMLRYGRSRTRGYCAQHERHCKEPVHRPHPPGGIDNERAPADWHPA